MIKKVNLYKKILNKQNNKKNKLINYTQNSIIKNIFEYNTKYNNILYLIYKDNNILKSKKYVYIKLKEKKKNNLVIFNILYLKKYNNIKQTIFGNSPLLYIKNLIK